MLERYWRLQGGSLYVEVPIGGATERGAWPGACTVRRIDAVLVSHGAPLSMPVRLSGQTARGFDQVIQSGPVRLVEVKASLNRGVIGQAIAARHMFKRQYGVAAAHVTILCSAGDAALQWVCEQEHIDVAFI